MPATDDQLDYVRGLAIGLIHVQLGNADPEWPTSSKAHPSFWVWVVLTSKGPLWPGARSLFPIRVRWDLWERVVVPLLGEPENQFLPDNGAGRNHGLLSQLNLGEYDNLVNAFASKLVDRLKAEGFLQPDPVVLVASGPLVAQSVENPEVVQRKADLEAAGGTIFERFDDEGTGLVYERFDDE